MILAVGRLECSLLIKDLIKIAKGQNEINEKNTVLGKFQHNDGWGISYHDTGGWHTYKSVIPIFDDQNSKSFDNVIANIIILHARKATVGEKSMENTQPLLFSCNKTYIFMHNGTLLDDIPTNSFVNGTSDSVKLFNHLLEHETKNDLFKNLNFDNYSSNNFIFANDDRILIGQMYKSNPQYSTLKYCKDQHGIIFSSEVLPDLKDRAWKNLQNHTIIEIDIKETIGSFQSFS